MFVNALSVPYEMDVYNLDLDQNLRGRREDKAAEQGYEPCTHCGRGVKPGAGFMTVVVNGGGRALHPTQVTPEDEADGGFMGVVVLGSTCAKGMPKSVLAPLKAIP